MKFLNLSVLLLASLASAAPLRDKYQCKDKLCYVVSSSTGGTAYIRAFNTGYTNSKTLDVPSSINIDGNVFKVNGVYLNTFDDLKTLEEINIPSGISKFTFSHETFNNCPKLKRVVLNNQVSDANDSAIFNSPNNNIVFQGKGVKTLTDSQVKYFLFRNMDMSTKKYQDLYDYQRKTDLFNLAKKLSSYARISSTTDGDNALTVMKTKYGTDAGRARLFRLLAIEMGYKSDEILVASDGTKYWNYVKADGVWYNVDVNYPFTRYTEYYEAEWRYPFLVGNKDFKKRKSISSDPKQWRVMYSNYGYKDEFRGQQTYDIFDQYLRQKKAGERKE
ncbi:hypothetical protein BCR32DRAFT_269646 [Anaeromyces robustus]|uniref:Transglutaminase-like domain-containing protein n=1 Tax=Anaeromyces robustus TaxID=1754192 RepID=A0A1Y1X0E1_9FUNG|nr:hypothetical protein BCR32DRAFT_269646 [Anaeromyces robustus]|eukprot:ORX79125.1 hypothetical protein BCR32DRAFT_269646 [Anaeromyces robustus]